MTASALSVCQKTIHTTSKRGKENENENEKITALLLAISLVLCVISCGDRHVTDNDNDEKIKIKLLFIPKFENGEMFGDDVGEAQLFYEEYCMDSIKYTLKNQYVLYVNKRNGVAMGLTHAGKANTIMFATAAMTDERFDFSDAYVMCIGCAGASYGNATMGDVAIISEAVDFDLGYQSITKDENGDVDIQWYDNPDTRDNSHKVLNTALVRWAYEKTKDIPLDTTETTLKILERNFPNQAWTTRQPKVLTGTSVSGDVYWKGEYEHQKACELAEYYGCADPYTITEMEDTSCAVAMDALGMLNRLLILRTAVNVDVFLDGETPESTWGNTAKYEDKVVGDNAETLDIFVPAMNNMFKVGKVLADAILAGDVMQ